MKNDIDFVDDDLEIRDTSDNSVVKVGKKITPSAIALSIVATFALGIYVLLDYRISQTDSRLEQAVEALKNQKVEIDLGDLENKLVARLADQFKIIDDKIEKVSERVTVLENKQNFFPKDLNVTELIQLRDDLKNKVKELDDLRNRIDAMEGKSTSATTKTPPVKEETVDAGAGATLPFKIVKIVQEDVVNILIKGQIYPINVNKKIIMDRYDIRVVDVAKQTVVIYDQMTNEYLIVKVGK